MPLKRRTVYSGAPWEEHVGYSWVTRVGQYVAVTGTAALGPYGPPSAAEDYRQACEILERIWAALAEVDAALDQVIRTSTPACCWKSKLTRSSAPSLTP